MTANWKTALCAAAYSQLGLAQVAPATILKIDTENYVVYGYGKYRRH
jgi:hypothetical protein